MRKVSSPSTRLLLLLSTALLSACGGGGSAAPNAVPEPRTLTTLETAPAIGTTAPAVSNPLSTSPALPVQPAPAPAPSPAPTVTSPAPAPTGPTSPTLTSPAPAPTGPTLTSPTLPPTTPIVPPAPPPSSPIAGVVTDVSIQSTSTTVQTNVPVTFGQVFAPGHVMAAQTVTGRLADGSTLPLDVDIKARHPDGSARHAIISATVPSLPGGATVALGLVTKSAPTASAPVSPAALLAAGFTTSVNIDLSGQKYTASADALLRSGKYKAWLSGAQTNEWLASAPLISEAGEPHPHLTARFAIRATGAAKARVDVTVESGWDYVPGTQNFKYNVKILVGGATVYDKPGLVHYHHARWRKMFWWGATPQVHIRHNIAYLIDTKAVPNYDRSIVFPEARLAALKTGWTGAKTEPMGVGMANPYMPSTGGRDDIGLLPGWATTYLLTMDARAKEVTLGTADLSGSWSSHYRDKKTDRPVSLFDYPAMTVLGRPGDTWNEAAKRFEQFPPCAVGADCASLNVHDASHQPNLAYLPYLVTGDYYYLEEMQFWGMWNSYMENPGYRLWGKALLKADQVRGQAWALRSLVEAAYITPDADPLKAQFAYFVDSNLDWYNGEYSNNAAANKLGVLTNGYAIVYENGTGLAPWQDDFFTSAVGHAAELGFEKAKPLLAYKAKFPIARMTAPGACWIDGAIYAMKVRNSLTAPVFSTMAEAYQASHTAEFNSLKCNSTEMAAALKLKVGEMTGYSTSVVGYPSNMQPAMAYAASAGGAAGAAAWSVFNNRSVKPDHSHGAQFAIVPR